MTLPDFYLIFFFLLALGQVSLAFYLWKSQGDFLKKISSSFGLPQQQQKNWSIWHKAQEKA